MLVAVNCSLGLSLLPSMALEHAGGEAHSRASREECYSFSVPGFSHAISLISLRHGGKVLGRPSGSEVRSEIVFKSSH